MIDIRFNTIIFFVFLTATHILAQDISTTNVKVVEGFRPSVPQATRLNEKAAFLDTLKRDRTQEYNVLYPSSLMSDYQTRPLKAAKVKPDRISELYRNKVSFSFGNVWSTDVSVLHNSMRSKTLSYGVLLSHFSNKYYIDEDISKNSRNSMSLYAKKINPKHIIMVNFDYDRRTALYSYSGAAFGLLDEEDCRNRFAYTKLSVSAISQELSSNTLRHHTTLSISDFNEFSENQIQLKTNLSKSINSLPVSLGIEWTDYLNYNNKDVNVKSTEIQSFNFSPSISFSKYSIDFELAMQADYWSDDSKIRIFPEFKLTKELVKDVLLISGGLRHSDQRNTFKSLSHENPYIHSFGTNQRIVAGNDVLHNFKTTDVDEVYVSMRNVLAKDEVFRGSVAYGSVKNFVNFINSFNSNYNRFEVAYIDLKQLQVHLHYDKQLSDIIFLKADVSFYKWNMDVFYKPGFTCKFSIPLNLRNKIKLIPTLSYKGKRYADENRTLSPQFHTNLGLYYNYTQNLGAYLIFNNLTNSKEEMWEDYREVGFNGRLGIRYSF